MVAVGLNFRAAQFSGCAALDAQAVWTLFDRLGLWRILDELLPRAKKGPPFADRVFVLLANRLVRPSSEHGLARWLETDFVCDRRGRRWMAAWREEAERSLNRELGATASCPVAQAWALRLAVCTASGAVIEAGCLVLLQGSRPARSS